jgi:uncharacterized protein (DUF1778 family)
VIEKPPKAKEQEDFLNIRITAELREKLEERAAQMRKSTGAPWTVSSVVRHAIIQLLSNAESEVNAKRSGGKR